ncbi:aminoacylase-1-like [Drosophila guanche]|uniref:N-acyl-aliphatic-L-amino acid amidohydrolase n=1 Tax=Drosophila guanche TaxID=7266 RepID=A0A3B0K096_DROGU|nr:aminoacylase-1-like [Drosophila guanche]XP_034126533.1 aminoacylase-1-like [Drosophila guanche]SPP81200.1 blast:Aminoacylase-1 [Drosophila guanche]
MSADQWENNEEIKIFREYLRIPTVHPNVDYNGCVEFLKRQAAGLDLPVDVVYPVNEKNPVVIMKWLGSQPELPSIILNSHTDVVPVFPEKWTHEPFSADLDAEGRIFARGSQDMKCVGTQYLGAIRALKASGYQPKRTVYLTYVPDEEVGGHLGMRELVKGDYFKNLNVGFSFDEGISSEDETYALYYAERTLWHLRLKISGTAGHGSLLLPNTAGEKLNYVVNKLMEFRKSQLQRLADDKSLEIGDVTTVNLTQLRGGVQSNVVPPLLEVVFDIRIAITVDITALEKQIRDWCEEAGGGIELEFEMKNPFVEPTKIDASNPFWVAFKQTLDDLGLKTRVRVFPGATDSRYVRYAGIPALGFSPINNTPLLLHDHDEFLRADTYLHGIEVYKKLIPAVADS